MSPLTAACGHTGSARGLVLCAGRVTARGGVADGSVASGALGVGVGAVMMSLGRGYESMLHPTFCDRSTHRHARRQIRQQSRYLQRHLRQKWGRCSSALRPSRRYGVHHGSDRCLVPDRLLRLAVQIREQPWGQQRARPSSPRREPWGRTWERETRLRHLILSTLPNSHNFAVTTTHPREGRRGF